MTTYKDLEWELKVPRECYRDSYIKRSFTFDESWERIRKNGGDNARHPYPSEVSGLICDSLKGKLSGDLKKVCDDMLDPHGEEGYGGHILPYGEWFSMAFKRRKDKLIVYLDPENLKWNEKRFTYIIDGKSLICSDQRIFNIKGKKSGEWIDLKEFGDDFFKFMYGKSFGDLPKRMRIGIGKAQVYLPGEEKIFPVSFSDNYTVRLGEKFCIGVGYGDRASRWVRPKKVKE